MCGVVYCGVVARLQRCIPAYLGSECLIAAAVDTDTNTDTDPDPDPDPDADADADAVESSPEGAAD